MVASVVLHKMGQTWHASWRAHLATKDATHTYVIDVSFTIYH